jgi:hypothetical protein
MGHEIDPRFDHVLRILSGIGRAGSRSESEAKTDQAGGLLPESPQRAKEVDFVTLPKGLPGTNCGNCRFVEKRAGGHFCRNEKVRFAVNARNCCALWDAKGTLRHFE